MKFSELWLREWVNPTLDSATLVDQITMAGLEVDSIEPVAGDFRGIVIGEVIECYLHPTADKLYLTKVKISDKRLLDVVCNAPNCRQGIKVAVATVGARLSNNFKIKAVRLHGKLSEGILCSFSDLAINYDHNGIIELPVEAPIGADVRKYLKLDDNIIEINITPNRADCFSIIGIARDVAALNKLPLNVPELTETLVTITDTFPVRIDAADACPQYLSRIIKSINIRADTPLWMKEKLRRGDIRSINPVVDVTNYVLLELGQPMYAFDLDKIDGDIVIRMAEQNEPFIPLDGNEIKLDSDTLVIADRYKILAMCGVFISKYSYVNTDTCNILLWCAWFSPLMITGRARRYGLYSNMSHRYEHGIDPLLQRQAIERVTCLLLNICGGYAGPVMENSDKDKLPIRITITLHREKINRLLGHYINDNQIIDILKRLGCKINTGEGKWQVVPPSWRFDIMLEEDLIEEVARIYGYANIPNVSMKANLVMRQYHETDLSLKRVKEMLVDKGYQEAITYSFVDPKVQALLHPGEKTLNLKCPISSEMSAMRLSLWTGLLSTVIYNQNRQQSRVRLFESGLRFMPDKKSNSCIQQDIMLAGISSGNRYEEHWDLTRQSVDFYDLKGDLESVLELTGKLDMIEFRAEKNPALHPGQSAAIYLQGKQIGYIGMVHPELESKLDLNSRTFVFELLWNKVANRILPDTCEISRFPMNRRDIAIVVAETVPAADIIAECKKIIKNQLLSVKLFDVYRGKGINKGFKSLAIGLILQDKSRTLEESEITETVTNCVSALKKLFQATLRE